jgi:hypothetical protein
VECLRYLGQPLKKRDPGVPGLSIGYDVIGFEFTTATAPIWRVELVNRTLKDSVNATVFQFSPARKYFDEVTQSCKPC